VIIQHGLGQLGYHDDDILLGCVDDFPSAEGVNDALAAADNAIAAIESVHGLVASVSKEDNAARPDDYLQWQATNKDPW